MASNSTLCPQCNKNTVAPGHYVCTSCEDKLTGRVSATSGNFSSNTASVANESSPPPAVAAKSPLKIPIIALSVVAVLVIGVAIVSLRRHVTQKKFVAPTPILMTAPFVGTYTWRAPGDDASDPNSVYKTYIFDTDGTVIDRRARHKDEKCTYSSDGKRVSIHHNFGMDETGVLSDDKQTFQYDNPPLKFVKVADAPVPHHIMPSDANPAVTDQPIVAPSFH